MQRVLAYSTEWRLSKAVQEWPPRQSGKAYGYLHTDPLEGGKYIQWEGGMGEGSAYPLHTHVE